MAKPFFWLIIVWSIICATGLAVFILQTYKPIIPATSNELSNFSTAIGFWIFIWIVPTIILALAGRRQNQ